MYDLASWGSGWWVVVWYLSQFSHSIELLCSSLLAGGFWGGWGCGPGQCDEAVAWTSHPWVWVCCMAWDFPRGEPEARERQEAQLWRDKFTTAAEDWPDRPQTPWHDWLGEASEEGRGGAQQHCPPKGELAESPECRPGHPSWCRILEKHWRSKGALVLSHCVFFSSSTITLAEIVGCRSFVICISADLILFSIIGLCSAWGTKYW